MSNQILCTDVTLLYAVVYDLTPSVCGGPYHDYGAVSNGGNPAVAGAGAGTHVEYISAGIDRHRFSFYGCDKAGVTVAVSVSGVFYLPPGAGF